MSMESEEPHFLPPPHSPSRPHSQKVMLPLEEFFLPPPLPYLCHDLKKKKTTKVSLNKRNSNYPRSTHLLVPSPPCLPFMS